MGSPYELERLPGIINFSGGRSSGYMLRQIVDYYGGKLPPEVAVVFCNTGKETPETLAFVEQCSNFFGVPVVWIEFMYRPHAQGGRSDPRYWFREVDFSTASRNGEPFAELIKVRRLLPNVARRFCTTELKVRPAARYVRSVLRWKNPTNYLGMRFDEPKRVSKALMEDCAVDYPLYHARVERRHVLAYWRSAPFDLQISDEQGNCDLCFLKGKGRLLRLLRDDPEKADWWIEQERRSLGFSRQEQLRDRTMAQFSRRDSVLELLDQSRLEPEQLPLFDEEASIDCFCGD